MVSDKDSEQFTRQLLYYLGAFAGGIPVSILLHSFRYHSVLGLLFYIGCQYLTIIMSADIYGRLLIKPHIYILLFLYDLQE